jgi:hypothetical protein
MLPRVALIYAVGWLVLLPLQFALGVLDVKLVLVPIVAWALASASIFLIYRRFATAQGLLKYQVMGASVALAISSVVFGPILILPTLVVMSTMGTILVSHPGRRMLVLVTNGLALLVPTALAWLGYFPVTHLIDGDRTLRIGFAAFALTRDGIFGILAAFNIMLIMIGAKFAAQYRDALTAAETKSEVQAWQLRQLVPDEAGRALAEGAASARSAKPKAD